MNSEIFNVKSVVQKLHQKQFNAILSYLNRKPVLMLLHSPDGSLGILLYRFLTRYKRYSVQLEIAQIKIVILQVSYF
jgi:hypothetical protein